MTTKFFCKNKDRWKKVKESNSVNGIDYLEILTEDQKTLRLYFFHDLGEAIPSSPPEPLPVSKDNIFIEGGIRIKNIRILNVLPVSGQKNALDIIVDKAGDFSNYTLRIGNSQIDILTSPDGFDM